MAKKHYSMCLFEFGDGEASGMGIGIERAEVVAVLRLPREASDDELMDLRRAITGDKPLKIVRGIAADWLRKLRLERVADQ